jgi:glycerophosphoryl diester phosphodiesterase
MKQRRRLSSLVLASLVASLLVLVAPPADASRLNLHRGSRGAAVRALEIRLARLYLLAPSAVDRRYRPETVHAVRQFQWRLGLPVTGRVDRRTWYLVAREPARRAAIPGPTILGHRGAVTTRTGENTLGAMQYAAPHVSLLEFDLHLTADHGLVLMHDTTLDRTTNCTGTVASWTIADLRAHCRVGAQVIPTFDEVAEYAARVGKPIAPELKDAKVSRDDLAKVVSVIQAHGLAGRTWVQSVYGSRFPALRALEPRLRTVLVSRGTPPPQAMSAVGATAVATPVSSLTIPRVHAYHAARVRVWAWTARTATDLQMARAMRADAVVTDVPATASALYRRG